jgi:transcription-repair coupling factor (superfamily II helicase)
LAVSLGFEKISLKDKTLRCFFINRPDSPYFESDTFRRILAYLQTGTNRAKLKQTGRLFLLVVDGVSGMADLHRILTNMHERVFEGAG